MNAHTRLIRYLWLFIAVATFLIAPSKRVSAQCAGVPASTTGAITWTPNWCDEFNGAANSAIDSTKWAYDTGDSGFGNNELENYCMPGNNTAPCSSANPNAFIDGNGHLAIQVRGPANSDCTPVGTCTSARLKTAGLQSFNSGRIEASIQIPSHAGLWPAFWNLGSQAGVSWPTVGESDVMENWPTTSNIAGPGATGNRSTIHTMVTGGSGLGQGFTFPSGQAVNTGFHAYGQIWSANMIQYYVDDPTKPFFVVTASDLPSGDTWPFSSSANPFFIIMNMAVGGTLGTPTDSQTSSQAPMLVDYVRQYLPSAVSAPQLTPNGTLTVKAGATSSNTVGVDLQGAMGTGRITFSCTTTAPKASCLVTSTDAVDSHTVDFTNSGAASVTVAFTSTANTSAALSPLNWKGLAAAGLFALVLFPLHKKAQVQRGMIAVVAFLALSLMPACGGSYGGGGGGGGNGGGGGSNGTPSGSYTMTVNAFTISSSDATMPSAMTNINVTVN